jgi:perosamine synthetase
LAKNGISSKVYFEPVHLTRFYREKFGYRGGELPVTERISGEVMSLPMYPVLTKQEIDHVVGKTSEFFGRN